VRERTLFKRRSPRGRWQERCPEPEPKMFQTRNRKRTSASRAVSRAPGVKFCPGAQTGEAFQMTVNRAAQQMKAVDQNGNDISSTRNWSSHCGLYTLMARIFSVAVLLLLAMPAVAQLSGTATITVTGTPITGHADCPSPCTIKVAGKNLVNICVATGTPPPSLLRMQWSQEYPTSVAPLVFMPAINP
jgi:hypothetical protein